MLKVNCQIMNKNEKNKLIADYMELSVSELHGDLCYADWDGMHSVKYECEWNWIMPVVLKIVAEYQSQAMIAHPGYSSYPMGNKKWLFEMLSDCTVAADGQNEDPLLATYDAVVNFLSKNKDK